MLQDGRNIYQVAREAACYTQEEAAELLEVSVESVSAYENDRRIPPERIVLAMAEVYRNRWLAYLHMKKTMTLADEWLPNISITDLPSAVLRLQKEVNDVLRWRERLIEITCDGTIDEQERPEFNGILKELGDLQGAIIALKYAKE